MNFFFPPPIQGCILWNIGFTVLILSCLWEMLFCTTKEFKKARNVTKSISLFTGDNGCTAFSFVHTITLSDSHQGRIGRWTRDNENIMFFSSLCFCTKHNLISKATVVLWLISFYCVCVCVCWYATASCVMNESCEYLILSFNCCFTCICTPNLLPTQPIFDPA